MTWLDDLEPAAPDPVPAFRGIEAERFLSVRREVGRRSGAGTAPALVPELDALAEALVAIVDRLPEDAFAFAFVHDLMHLEQLHGLEAGPAPKPDQMATRPAGDRARPR